MRMATVLSGRFFTLADGARSALGRKTRTGRQ